MCRILVVAFGVLAMYPSYGEAQSRERDVYLISQKGFGSNITNDSPKVAAAFLKALQARNLKQLSRFVVADADFFATGGKLQPWFSDFVSSVEKIGRSELAIKIVPQASDRFIALYIPKAKRGKLEDIKFLQTRWMEEYFACEFSKTQEGYKLHVNFCFAESDGPFPVPYG